MSDVAPIGPTGTPSTSMPATTGTNAGQQVAGAQQATSSSQTGSVSTVQSQQSMSMSMSSTVQTLAESYGYAMQMDEVTRSLVVLALLLRLLEMMEGGEDKGQLIAGVAGALGQGQSTSFFLSNTNFQTSLSMSSSSYQMTASEAYAANATTSGQAAGTTPTDIVAPTDTQAGADAGDGGHQLNVIA